MANKTAFVPKVKGVTIELNGTEFILPPLPVKAFSKFDAIDKINAIQADFDKMKNGGSIGALSKETIINLVSLVGMALRRNYEEITDDEVEDGLSDITSLFNMFQYLISQNADVKKQMEEARKNALREFVTKEKQ